MRFIAPKYLKRGQWVPLGAWAWAGASPSLHAALPAPAMLRRIIAIMSTSDTLIIIELAQFGDYGRGGTQDFASWKLHVVLAASSTTQNLVMDK